MQEESIEHSPPRRMMTQLETWVREFRQEGHLVAGDIRVAPQEDDGGQDTGLVVMDLQNVPASIYVQAAGYDNPQWEATLTALDDQTFAPHHLASLAAEIAVAANLCTFLQWKSLDWDRQSGRRDLRPDQY